MYGNITRDVSLDKEVKSPHHIHTVSYKRNL